MKESAQEKCRARRKPGAGDCKRLGALPLGRDTGKTEVIVSGAAIVLKLAVAITSPLAFMLSGLANPAKVPVQPANTKGEVAVALKIRGVPFKTNPSAGGIELAETLHPRMPSLYSS